MTVRAVEGKKPYTGGKAIEIDENKVISLRLREENNLIIYDEGDDEIYVDLQLNDEIRPTDAFPVGVTTGRVIVDNGWDVTGTVLIFKTTSGDYVMLLYGDDGKLYIDNGTGSLKQIYLKPEIDAILQDYATKQYVSDNFATIEYTDLHDTQVSDTQPSDPTEGMLWYNTTTHKLKVYNGTQWEDVGTGGGGGTYTAGFGININQNDEIGVDTTVVALNSNLGTASACNTGTSSGNVPVLDANGKLNTSTLPGVALTDTFTVTNKSDLTSLTNAEQGDLGMVTSENKTYVLSQDPYSTLANWLEILAPNTVASVNGQTGVVTLDADDIDDTNTTNKFVTATEKSTWSGKQDVMSAGTGIDITNNEISVDTDVVQKKLIAGNNVTIITVGHPNNQGPCPDGFHIPTKDEATALRDMHIPLEHLKVPMGGERSTIDSDVIDAGTNAYYWTSTATSNSSSMVATVLRAYNGHFDRETLGTCYGNFIRGFRNYPIIPDSSWTLLYQSGSNASYHNPTLGLISVTDGTDWITIADKNLGATQVYNLGDTMSEANCGKFYQRGNNYGFAYSGTVTNESNQVDASTYGPGNYYYSSTFLTRIDTATKFWDSSKNTNLRGGGNPTGTRGSMEEISSMDTNTKYTAGNGITIDANNEISVDTTVVATQSDISVVSGDAGVTYIIKKSTTPPPAGTPSNVLTFVG